MVVAQGPCQKSDCDHDPACGYASIHYNGETLWFCHSDEHTCYEGAIRELGLWKPDQDMM